MKVYPEQLEQQLQQGLKSCYLLVGDEPLLQLEAINAIRHVSRQLGFDEYHRFQAGQGMDWNALHDVTQALSLFSQRQCILLEFEKRPNKDELTQLNQLMVNLHDDILLLISLPRLNKQQQSAKWFSRYAALGDLVLTNPPDQRRWPVWIQQRLRHQGLSAHPDAIAFICRNFEGNLLAAKQEIDKLALRYPGQQLSLPVLQQAIEQQSHFNPFHLVDALLDGKVNRAQRILQQLQAEGVELLNINWVLLKELKQLFHLASLQQQGESLTAAFSKIRIWPQRQQQLNQALARLSLAKLEQLLLLSGQIDRQIKQFDLGSPWDRVALLCSGFKDSNLLPDALMMEPA